MVSIKKRVTLYAALVLVIISILTYLQSWKMIGRYSIRENSPELLPRRTSNLTFLYHNKNGIRNGNDSNELLPLIVYPTKSNQVFLKLLSQQHVKDQRKLLTGNLSITVDQNSITVANISTEHQPYMCMGNNFGGRGNKLSQLAAFYGLKHHFNMTGLLDYKIFAVFHDHTSILKTPFIVNVNKVCKNFNRIDDVTHARFSRMLVDNFDRTIDHMVNGFFHSWMYFYEVMDELRKDLEIVDYIRDEAQEVLRRTTDRVVKNLKLDSGTKFTYVAIHIRRSIITNDRYLIYGTLTPHAEFYYRAMTYFEQRYENVLFLIFSDDTKWVMENIRHPRTVHFRGNPTLMDMTLMIGCNHTIMSVGSFGWWTGFFTGGEVVYHWTQAREGTRFSLQFSSHQTDLFPPYWIPM